MFGVVGDNTVDQYVGEDTRWFVGGNAVNVAAQLNRLGRQVRYLGAVGADPLGHHIRAALAALGVQVDGVVTLDGVTSVTRIRVTPDGDRIFEFEDFAVCADYRPGEDDLGELSACQAVHIGMLPGADSVRRHLSRHGVFVTQDCAVSAGYDHLDVAFCSAGGHPGAERALAGQAVAGGAALAVVTRGAEGSVAFDGRRWWTQPALPTDVVDTTGAGDSFIAGFLSAIADGSDVDQALAQGAARAARTCEHHGGWPQKPIGPVRVLSEEQDGRNPT